MRSLLLLLLGIALRAPAQINNWDPTYYVTDSALIFHDDLDYYLNCYTQKEIKSMRKQVNILKMNFDKLIRQAITDLLSGQVELNFESPPNTLQHIKAGKLKALGITSAKRSALLPDVPTIAEQGLPGYEIIQWLGILGPPGMPKPVVDKLNAEVNAIMKTPEFAEKVASQGGLVYGGSPEDFAAYIRNDVPKWDKLVKAANIKLD